MNQDKFIQAVMIVVFCLFVLTALTTLSKEAKAAPGMGTTECSEWATMTQILVLRWQGENLPKKDGTQATNEDVKENLRQTMKGHPELEYALTWVDYAWKNREGNPVHVWQAAKANRELCAAEGIDLLIYCTYRSNEEQAAEYAKGRTAPGKIVTYAKPGESKHNHTINGQPASLAYDAVPLVGGKAAWNDARLLQRMGELGEQAGLQWAGRWKRFKETVHFQLGD